MTEPFGLTTPCKDCPFRTDVTPYLRKSRVREIRDALVTSTFPCHKTVEHDDDGEPTRTGREVHCAGALILMEKSGRSSNMMRIAERIGLYDRTKLNYDAPVFESFGDMINAQRR